MTTWQIIGFVVAGCLIAYGVLGAVAVIRRG